MPGGAIAVASDHAGFDLKEIVKRDLHTAGLEVLDLGTDSTQSVDYPDFGMAMADPIACGKARRGVLVCGTGIGISIAANRPPGVSAAVVHDATSARLARAHNDANVVAFGQRLIGVETAHEAVQGFLSTKWEAGRHSGRVAKLSKAKFSKGCMT
jgi:ribose 5-phosphate isomerase B